MKAIEIFIEFEKQAIMWGKQYQIARVGDIVTSNLGGKRPKKVMISSVSVTCGRHAQKTTKQTFVLSYVGRRVNANNELIDSLGTGRWLREFITSEGKIFNHSQNEVTEESNDSGFYFIVDFDSEAKKLYPNAYKSYSDSLKDFTYSR